MATLTGKKLKNWYKSLWHFSDELPASGTKKTMEDGDGNTLPFKVSTGGIEFTGTVEGIEKADVGLSNVDNTSDANKPVSTAQAAADVTAENNAKAYADTLVVGLIDDRGNHDASGNVFPSTGGSGTAGAIKKGDLWTVSVPGTLGGTAVTAGDLVRALIDTPGQTASNWAVTENNIGYVAENTTNKSTNIDSDQASNTKYASVKAVFDWAVGLFLQKSGGSLTGAINEAKGSNIASASSIDLGAATGNMVDITGSTTITALGTVQAGTRRFVRFIGSLILTHNGSSLILPTSANITTAAGDTATFISLGSGNWVCMFYQRKDGTALSAAGGGGDMLASNNLSEVNPAAARTNIGAEDVSNKDTDGTLTATSDTKYPSQKAVKTYADAREVAAKAYADTLVVGLIDDRGNYDASGNVFPSSGGSGSAGAVKKGDLWTVNVPGTLGGTAVTAGDLVRALIDTPGQTASNWAVTENNIGYVAENTSNKSTDVDADKTSNVKYSTPKSIYDWATGLFATISNLAGKLNLTGGSLSGALNEAKGSDIASASTTDIGAATGNYVHVTGTTTITALGIVQAGTRRVVQFTGALTLTHHATSLILPTGANIATAAGDVAIFISLGSGNWKCVNYMRADGTPLAGGGGGGTSREVISATLSGKQTNYSISGASPSRNVTTELRVDFSGASFVWQSLDTTSWEDGKPVTIVNDTVSDSSGARFVLFENQEGGSGTQFRYLFNGVPPIILPGDFITFRLNTTDGFLDFECSNSFGASAESGFNVYSDFVGGPAIAPGGAANGLGPFVGIQGNGSCAYTSSFQTSPINPFGILDLSTHTNSTGSFFVGSANAAMMRGGMGCALFLARATPTTALSDGTNTYTIILGFNDAHFGAPVDAIVWKYDQAAATVWRTSTISNSSETVNDQSGFTVSISTMPYLGIFCNGNWTNIEFFYSVDGQTWVIGNAHTTNVPTGTSRTFGFGAKIQKSLGTVARLMSLDLMGLRTMHIRG